ncbi:MAG: hypothetical protein GXX08_02170 [Firmicutes bacterium]|nr:hypothetical protein [Bacillota bacterium]
MTTSIAHRSKEGGSRIRWLSKGRVGVRAALALILCVAAVIFGTGAVAGSETVGVAFGAPEGRIIDSTGPDSGQKLITQQRVEMLVRKDFWTHRLEVVGPCVGDLWILESPFQNELAAGDFLNFTVVFLNGSSDSAVDFSYTVNMRKDAQKGLNQDGEIIKSYHIDTTLGPKECYFLYPIFFFDEAGDYWLEMVYNDSATAGRSIQVFENYEY